MARPEKWKDDFVNIARHACRLGATDLDLAEMLKVSLRTIRNWRATNEAFAEALQTGKEPADENVTRSLYNRAVGYSFESEKVFQHQGEVIRVPIIEHVPPDVTAQIFWLKNRRPKEWRDRHEVDHSHTITLAELVSMSYREDLPALPVPKIINGAKNDE